MKKQADDSTPLLYLGQTYALQPSEATRDQVYIEEDQLVVHYKPRENESPLIVVGKLLLEWYAKQAGSTLSARTAHWGKMIGVSPSRITIRDQKTRWGSCSSKGSINYSWRLIMAPSKVIDYLVVHELCHMLQANHSKAYWELVAHYIPDYAAQRQWLKTNGNLLMQVRFK